MDPPKKKSLIRHSGWFARNRASQPRPVRQAHPGEEVGVGDRTFGRASVNCALRGKESKWGKLGDKDAAVLQLFIDPRQDEGFKLSEFAVEWSFAEKDPRPQQDAVAPASCTATAAAIAAAAAAGGGGGGTTIGPKLTILKPPSPRYLVGPPNTQHSSRELLVQPEVAAGGFNFGGVGIKSTRDKDVERSWRFQSHWANNDLGHYTDAQWTWKAATGNPENENVSDLFGGVVIEHPGQPFYLTCKISARLVSSGKKFRYGNGDQRPHYTLIHPENSLQSLKNDAEQLEKVIIDLIRDAAAETIIPKGDELKANLPDSTVSPTHVGTS